MSDNTLDFSSIQASLTGEGIELHAAEIHGVLTGLVCGGYTFENSDYTAMIEDLFNNGETLPGAIRISLKLLFGQLWQAILDDSYTFTLLLPDDDDALVERGHALSVWVQGFNLGFGLQQKNHAVMSEDVKEVLSDFAEIANLSEEIDDDEASEQAFFEIAEYVRISALLCFSELGNLPEQQNDQKTLH